MPRLVLTFQQVKDILAANGFAIDRQNGTSHAQYKAVIAGETRLVTVAGKPSDEVAIGTLQSMMRQSGLSKKAFRR